MPDRKILAGLLRAAVLTAIIGAATFGATVGTAQAAGAATVPPGSAVDDSSRAQYFDDLYGMVDNGTPYRMSLLSADAPGGWSQGRQPSQPSVEPDNSSDWWVNAHDSYDVTYRFIDGVGEPIDVTMKQDFAEGAWTYDCSITGQNAADWMCDTSASSTGETFAVMARDPWGIGTQLRNRTGHTLTLTSATATDGPNSGWSDHRSPTEATVQDGMTSSWWIKRYGAFDVTYQFPDDQGNVQTVLLSLNVRSERLDTACVVVGPGAEKWSCQADRSVENPTIVTVQPA